MATVVIIRVKFFASLRESVGLDELEVALDAPPTLERLIDALRRKLDPDRFAPLEAEDVKVAVNQVLVSGAVELNEGDEVAFLPPVTGG